MYDAWCDDCCGAVHAVTNGALVTEWETRARAEYWADRHRDSVGEDHHVIVARV